MTMYDHPGGALVFATGSFQRSWGRDSLFGGETHPTLVNPAVQQIMRNVMTAFTL